MALSFYMGLLVPVAAPIVVLYNLVYAGSLQGFSDDVPGRLIDDVDDEYGAIVFA